MTNPLMYQVIEKNNVEDLICEVQTWVDNGWTPQGGIMVYPWTRKYGVTEYASIQSGFGYAQAMVLYLENVDPKELEALKNLGEENA